MTKEQLRQWLLSMATIFSGLGKWMWGPLVTIKPFLYQGAAFFNSLAGNDFVLNIILGLVSQGAIHIPHGGTAVATQAEVAMLHQPTGEHLARFSEAIPDDPSAVA